MVPSSRRGARTDGTRVEVRAADVRFVYKRSFLGMVGEFFPS